MTRRALLLAVVVVSAAVFVVAMNVVALVAHWSPLAALPTAYVLVAAVVYGSNHTLIQLAKGMK